MYRDTAACLAAIAAKDARFDGMFYTAVSSTGIYCRPSCPARTPSERHVTFHPSAAAAQRAGFRACKRCRPDASPGSPQWDVRGDVVARAMRLIADGVVDREGVPGLARRLGYSTRQLQRLMVAELGAGPLAVARAQRAQTARTLIEGTDLTMSDIAFAAGFSSLRSFNATMQEVFDTPAAALRRPRGATASSRPRRHRHRGAGPGAGSPAKHPSTRDQGQWIQIALRLPVRAPFCPDNVFGHLAATAVPGVETWHQGTYHRTVRVCERPAVVSLTPVEGAVQARVLLSDTADLAPVIARCRRLLDLDADPQAIDAHLARDPALADLVTSHPGRRVPRTVDSEEMAVRVLLGQQVSTRAAATHAARLVEEVGQPLATPVPGLTHLFPTADAIAGVDDRALALPATRRVTVRALAAAVADGAVDLGVGSDRAQTREALSRMPGIGPWTVETIAMRALGDPDAFPASDLGLRAAARSRHLAESATALDHAAASWRPWRSYATQYLWADTDHPVNHLPGDTPATGCTGRTSS